MPEKKVTLLTNLIAAIKTKVQVDADTRKESLQKVKYVTFRKEDSIAAVQERVEERKEREPPSLAAPQSILVTSKRTPSVSSEHRRSR